MEKINFNSYQAFTESLARYNTAVFFESGVESDLEGNKWYSLQYLYPVLGLAEEAGEVAGKVAKFVRKSLLEPVSETQLRLDVKKELGDVLYQLSESARMFGFTLEDIALSNIDKLTDRKERGVLIGEGDNR